MAYSGKRMEEGEPLTVEAYKAAFHALMPQYDNNSQEGLPPGARVKEAIGLVTAYLPDPDAVVKSPHPGEEARRQLKELAGVHEAVTDIARRMVEEKFLLSSSPLKAMRALNLDGSPDNLERNAYLHLIREKGALPENVLTRYAALTGIG